MDFNLRGAVMANVANSSKDQLQHTIVDAIQQGEEKYLPGLGVLFEALWNHATEEQNNRCLKH
ncbi:small acid-soluble spore protein SspI [Anoxybacillus flavithermus]|uniref:Small acid-soluble spore protein SspI n=1 Tax=Anoxybacillus flavithermus TaxID=33934 RepID=A0A094LBP5_9BACL|nr:small acid-soluble spore protein SspI [Anoxybacillus flavithermus]